MNNELITIMEMANLLRISRSTAYALTKNKSFPMIKIGKNIRIDKNELLKWLHNEKNVL